MPALTCVAPIPVLPDAQRASKASQQNRLAIALTRNRQLAHENDELRSELETALGHIRAQRLSSDQPGEPRHRSVRGSSRLGDRNFLTEPTSLERTNR